MAAEVSFCLLPSPGRFLGGQGKPAACDCRLPSPSRHELLCVPNIHSVQSRADLKGRVLLCGS